MRVCSRTGSALVAVLLAAGCGGSTDEGSPETARSHDRGYRACFDQLGDPLKASDLVSAFEREGFTLHSLAESRYCDGAGIDLIAEVSNDRSADDREAREEQGWVTCSVHRDTVFGDPRANLNRLHADLDVGPYSPVGPKSKALFVLANVSCTHYPPSDDADAWTGRAHAAMKHLERELAAG